MEARREDDAYYQGAFWIIADSFSDIMRGKFRVGGAKFLSSYDGDYLSSPGSKRSLTHKRLWDSEYCSKLGCSSDTAYNYYPRGRVSIYKGVAYVIVHSRCNIPQVVDAVVAAYGVSKLEIEVQCPDETQGSHYDFELE